MMNPPSSTCMSPRLVNQLRGGSREISSKIQIHMIQERITNSRQNL